MEWTYSGDPSESELDKYRFLIGDVEESTAVLSDGEINYILETHENHNLRLYNLFTALTDRYARQIRRSLGPQMEDPTGRLEYFKERKEHFGRLCGTAGIRVTDYASPKIFKKGMHNNV